MVTVCFIDYGNQQTTPISEMKFLKQDFFLLPAIGIRCRFPDAQKGNWTLEMIKDLKKFIGEPMMLNFGPSDLDGTWEIELTANETLENFYKLGRCQIFVFKILFKMGLSLF